jgi:tetratricopeptide (TPR) repeat protein
LRNRFLLASLLALFQFSSSAYAAINQKEIDALKSMPATARNQFIGFIEQASKDFQNKKWAEAEAGYAKAIELVPGSFYAHDGRAYALARLGKTDQARSEEMRAREIDPENAEAILFLADLNKNMGNLADAAKFYDLFVNVAPKDPRVKLVSTMAGDMRAEAARYEAISKEFPEDKDYFGFATYDVTTRWPAEKFPLKVYIPTAAEMAKVPYFRPEFPAILKQAFEEWQTKSNGAVRFTFVPDKSAMDIECVFTNAQGVVGGPEDGEAQPLFRTDTGIFGAKVSLMTGEMTFGEEVHTVALHEIGHALGLIGHSPNHYDIMFFAGGHSDEVRNLTDRDVHTLLRLYSPDTKLGEHTHQRVANDEQSMLAEGLHLMHAHKIHEAAAIFEPMLKTDPQNEAVRFNLALCLNFLAVEQAQKGKLDDAVTQLHRMIELAGTNKMLLTQAWRNIALICRVMKKPVEAKQAYDNAIKLDPNAMK